MIHWKNFTFAMSRIQCKRGKQFIYGQPRRNFFIPPCTKVTTHTERVRSFFVKFRKRNRDDLYNPFRK